MSYNCDETPEKPCPAGVPPWVLTFADLMSLLLAFFVLLFSFSEMDRQKYKQVAGSMRDAFGIQREIKVKEPPKGINIIAQEFSAGTPDQRTPLNELRQHTTNDFRQYLKLQEQTDAVKLMLEEESKRIRLALADEIEEGFVEVGIKNGTIVIRILEQGSFASASTDLIEPFRSVLQKMARTIGANPGVVVVAGHTDDLPIFNSRFRSNWELSASRAVTVVHELMQHGSIPTNRFRIEGYGATKPIATNQNDEGRARNRRVEVTMLYDDGEVPVREQDLSGVGEAWLLDFVQAVDQEKDGLDNILPSPCPGCDSSGMGNQLDKR